MVTGIRNPGFTPSTRRKEAPEPSRDVPAVEAGKLLPPAETVMPGAEKAIELDSRTVERVVEVLTEFIQSRHEALQVSHVESSDGTLIQIINRDTQVIIRRLATDDILKLSHMIAEGMEKTLDFAKGFLLQEKG